MLVKGISLVNTTPFKFKHMDMLLDMHSSHKYDQMNTIAYKTLPKIGYIAYQDDMPIAAGFLRRVEPCYAQIDTLVSNAYCGAILRNEGIRLVVENLLNEAKRLKLKGIIAHTRDKGTLERAEALGFHIVPQTIIALSLQETT